MGFVSIHELNRVDSSSVYSENYSKYTDFYTKASCPKFFLLRLYLISFDKMQLITYISGSATIFVYVMTQEINTNINVAICYAKCAYDN